MMGKVFSSQRRIEFCETDAAGIAHFSSYLCYMEQVEHEFLRSLGHSVVQRTPSGDHISWPRVRVECNYSAPARFEEILQVSLQISRLGSKSVTYQFTFQSPAGEVIAKGELVAVCCLVSDHGRQIASIDIPAELRTLLFPYTISN